MAVRSILELIGNTPMLEVTHLDTGPCRLFLKLESQNPGGSIKDRIAVSMIEAAERRGLLEKNALLVEATAGNTGLGLALVAGQKGYRLKIVVPDKMSQEKIFHLRAMGAEVVLTRSDVGKGHPEYYQDLAERLAREEGGVFMNQFANDANPAAHEKTTGPEIWAQLEHKVDAVVCGVGTGGTLTGLSRFFAKVSPATQMVLADPAGSILKEYVETKNVSTEVGSWLVEGIGEDFIPPVSDLSRVKTAYSIPDKEAFMTCRALLEREGILAGTSTGTLVSAALRYCREQAEPRRVVSFVCDSGNKYLSKVYNDYWMIDQGLLEQEHFGDLRDLIARRHREHAVVSAGPDETVLAAYQRMKLYSISQLPVMEGDRVVGLVTEEDILLEVLDNPGHFREPVREAMEIRLVTVRPDESIDALVKIFDRGLVALVADEKEFHGLITRIDLLNWLRRKL
ncbi:MAG TPA: pyridoxal-phosphate dependent enzyme [Burkholderiales bacterium]|nr:pyridoxal-phosphate dependent enzyme [Burkholderiales bacterium]